MAEEYPLYQPLCLPPPPTAGMTPEQKAAFDVVGLLKDIRDLLVSGKPRGILIGFIQSVTNDSSESLQFFNFFPALFDIELTNDGPNPVEYRIPNVGDASWIRLMPGETDAINGIYGVFGSFAVRLLNVGDSASTIRVRGLY